MGKRTGDWHASNFTLPFPRLTRFPGEQNDKRNGVFSFLLGQYAFFKKTTADKVLNQLDRLNLTNRVFNMYEMYHSEAIENAFADIDRMIRENRQKTKK